MGGGRGGLIVFFTQSSAGVALRFGLAERERLLLLWLADGDRERDRETERPLGAEPDRDRDLLTGVLDLERAGEPDLLLRLEYDGDRRRLLLWLRLRERER